MRCLTCGSEEGVRHFAVTAVTVDGYPLRAQAHLCRDHGDSYLLRVGKVLGEMLAQNGESGRSISAEPTQDERFAAVEGEYRNHQCPLSNKTGRSGLPPLCRCGHENGEHCGRDGLGMCDVQVRPGELCECDGFTP